MSRAKELLNLIEKKEVGEYYVDHDKKTDTWCVFHTDKGEGKAFASFTDKKEAEKKAKEMNRK